MSHTTTMELNPKRSVRRRGLGRRWYQRRPFAEGELIRMAFRETWSALAR
jgi:hypothetical protein